MTFRRSDGQTDRRTGGQTDRRTGGQADRRTGGQADRQTEELGILVVGCIYIPGYLILIYIVCKLKEYMYVNQYVIRIFTNMLTHLGRRSHP